MQTLETGNCREGFTLIEIIIVLFIILLAASILIPRFLKGDDEKLRFETRRLVSLISYLTAEAAFKKMSLKLHYDLDRGRYWAIFLEDKGSFLEEVPFETSYVKGSSLLEGITFYEVAVNGKAMRNGGTASTVFTPWGYRDRTYIYLKGGDKVITIAVPSIGEDIRVYEGYRAFQNRLQF